MNEPAVVNVAVNDVPGAIEPEFQTPVSDVDVCAIESVFVHVTLPPTFTAIGFGEDQLAPLFWAFATIDAATDEAGGGLGVGVGVGVGVGAGDFHDPHPAANAIIVTASTHPKHLTICSSSLRPWRGAVSCPRTRADESDEFALSIREEAHLRLRGSACAFAIRKSCLNG